MVTSVSSELTGASWRYLHEEYNGGEVELWYDGFHPCHDCVGPGRTRSCTGSDHCGQIQLCSKAVRAQTRVCSLLSSLLISIIKWN